MSRLENLRKPQKTVEKSKFFEKYSPFLKEAKRRLLFVLYAFLISTILGFVFYEDIIRFLVNILSLEGVNIVFTSPFQFINLAISCGVAVGLITVFPLILYQLLMFLKPALAKKEFKIITKYIPFSIILFLIGFVFGSLIMKWQIEIFLSQSLSLGIGNILDISKLLSTVLLTSSIMGLGFQFPIVLIVITRFGLIDKTILRQKRKWVYLGAFLFALLLPLDSVLLDVILALPLIILYEVTLWMI